MAQIRSVVSDSLQATIRRLLPSQQGFTEDLQASNVIQPIIDLTPTAEGETLLPELSQALSYDNTWFSVSNGTSTLISTTGFYRVFANVTLQQPGSGASRNSNFSITDGTTSKFIWLNVLSASSSANQNVYAFDFIVCLGAGESLTCYTDNTSVIMSGSHRQIADINGNIVNPTAYTPQ